MRAKPQRQAWALALAGALAAAGVTAESAELRRVILIGGVKSEGAAQHDYPAGVRVLKAVLDSSPDVKGVEGLVVDAYPDG